MPRSPTLTRDQRHAALYDDNAEASALFDDADLRISDASFREDYARQVLAMIAAERDLAERRERVKR
jgi:hypothetical protein